MAGPHEFGNAKIAFSQTYTINANWKLVYENNRECYHCVGSHPEYIKSNYDTTFTYSTDPVTGEVKRQLDPAHPRQKEIEQHMDERSQHWYCSRSHAFSLCLMSDCSLWCGCRAKLGFECTPDNNFPGEGWYRASRQPLRKGWVTESLDGKPVSRLMGRLPEQDMGSLRYLPPFIAGLMVCVRIHTLPNFWVHASSDHACSARLTPTGLRTTEAKVDWIVHKDAVEGKDYSIDKMIPFWQKTSEQVLFVADDCVSFR